MKRFVTVTAVLTIAVVLAVVGCTEQASNAAPADGAGQGHGMRGGHGGGGEQMFQRYDTNKDGKITKDEFAGPDEVFGRLDANGDGAITQDEVGQLGQRMGGGRGGQGGNMDPAQRWQRMLEHMDADKDGKISKAEFTGPEQAFGRMDGNGDGFITEDEAARLGRGEGQGPQMTPAEHWQHMTEHMDANQDGKISKDEFDGRDEMFARFDANGDGFITEDEAAAMGQRRSGRGGEPFAHMDADGDGKVTREEWTAAFDKLDTNGDGVLDRQDRPQRGANAE